MNETFNNAKAALLSGELDDLVYDSPYSDYIDGLYSKAVEQLCENYYDLFIEPSIQAGCGGVFAQYEYAGVVYEARWDFECECERIDELFVECNTEQEVVNGIYAYIEAKLEDASPVDDDDDYCPESEWLVDDEDEE